MRAVLLIQDWDGAIKERPLSADALILGREEACELVFASPIISRQHARLSRQAHGYVLEDLGSRNGTMVNGQLLSGPHLLRDGDRIELGNVWKMTYADADATSTKVSPRTTGIWLDVAQQDVYVEGILISPRLSPAQYAFLQLLVAREGRICTRQEVILAVWPDATAGVSDEAVDAIIKRVRQRLAEVPNGGEYLVTLRSRGVMLKAPTLRPLRD